MSNKRDHIPNFGVAAHASDLIEDGRFKKETPLKLHEDLVS